MSNGNDPRLRQIAELLIGAQASIRSALQAFGEIQAQAPPDKPKRNEPPVRFGQKKIRKDEDDGGATQARVSAADAAPPDQE